MVMVLLVTVLSMGCSTKLMAQSFSRPPFCGDILFCFVLCACIYGQRRAVETDARRVVLQLEQERDTKAKQYARLQDILAELNPAFGQASSTEQR